MKFHKLALSVEGSEDGTDILGADSDIALAKTLINTFLILCCCSSDTTQYLLRSGNYLIFSLVSLLQNCQNESIQASVFRLLRMIVVKLVRSAPPSFVFSGSGDGAALVQDGEDFIQSLDKFCSFRAAVEAVKSNDKGMCVFLGVRACVCVVCWRHCF